MSERTEAPTPRRLADARAEGRVARSMELNTAVTLLVGVLLVQTAGGRLVAALQDILRAALLSLPEAEPSGAWIASNLAGDALRVAPSLALLVGVLLLAGVAATLVQTGFLWASKRVGFDAKRLDFIAGLKRLFSLHGLVELAKASLKLFIVGWVAYSFLRGHVNGMLSLAHMDLAPALQVWVGLAISLGLRTALVYLLLAAADYAYQRWQYDRSMRMTKEEVKEDMKSTEGDPFIRSRIKGQQRRMARMRMMANVPKADVVITNPTHLAVAVKYEADKMAAPRVLAKGADQVAQRIMDLARRSSVPVVQNVPVARALYKLVQIDEEVPPELYAALAEVLAYVYRLRGRLPSAGRA